MLTLSQKALPEAVPSGMTTSQTVRKMPTFLGRKHNECMETTPLALQEPIADLFKILNYLEENFNNKMSI